MREIQFVREARRSVHLHHLFRQGPAMLRGVKTAYSLCGLKLSCERLTSHAVDATCKECILRGTKLQTGGNNNG